MLKFLVQILIVAQIFGQLLLRKWGCLIKENCKQEREINEGNSKETDSKSEKYVLAKDTVIQYYKEYDKVLVIDDFHYASKEMQAKMAQQLKDAIRRELKVVVVSLPHRADKMQFGRTQIYRED